MLAVWSLSSHSRIFNSYGDVTIAGEGLQILTYAQHLWPLSSEGSLTCHTHCDAGLPFIMVISEDPWHSHLMPSVWQWSCHYLFLQLRSVMSPDLPHVRRTLYLSYCECSLSGFAFIIYQNLGLLCSSEYINQLFTSRIALSLKIKPILFIFFVVNSDSV